MLKRLWLVAVLAASTAFANQQKPTEGTTYVVSAPTHSTQYQHINVPALRTLNKRSVVANYKSIHGITVLVTKVEETNGSTIVTLKRKDGKKFFRHYKTLTANLDEALANGELQLTK